MQENGYRKQYFLDYSHRRELCLATVPGQPQTLTERPVGTGLCALLNIDAAQLEKLLAQLQKLLPMTSRDPDAYAVMLSIKLGNVPLPDSAFAAKLFRLLERIAELDDLFYVGIQMDRLLNQFEQNAPEKEIIRWMAAVAAWAANALDTAIELLPVYRERVDAVLSHTLLELAAPGETPAPVLSRALAYQQKTADVVLQLQKPLAYRVFARAQNTLTELFADSEPPEDATLFYGNALERIALKDILLLLFQQMLLADTVVRICGVCGRYFVPTVRSNEKYCDFSSPDPDGTPLTCKQRSTKIRLDTDASLKLLKGAYDKNFIKAGRKSDPTYRDRIFRPWYAWAKQQRQRYLDAELELEQLIAQLQRSMEDYRTIDPAIESSGPL